MAAPDHLEEARVVLQAERHVVARAQPAGVQEVAQPVGPVVELGVGDDLAGRAHHDRRLVRRGGGVDPGVHAPEGSRVPGGGTVSSDGADDALRRAGRVSRRDDPTRRGFRPHRAVRRPDRGARRGHGSARPAGRDLPRVHARCAAAAPVRTRATSGPITTTTTTRATRSSTMCSNAARHPHHPGGGRPRGRPAHRGADGGRRHARPLPAPGQGGSDRLHRPIPWWPRAARVGLPPALPPGHGRWIAMVQRAPGAGREPLDRDSDAQQPAPGLLAGGGTSAASAG